MEVNFITNTGTNYSKISVREIQERLEIKHIKFSSKNSVLRKSRSNHEKEHIIFQEEHYRKKSRTKVLFFQEQLVYNTCIFPGAQIAALNRYFFPGAKCQNNRHFFQPWKRFRLAHKEGLYFSNQENIPATIFTCQSLLKILKTHPHSSIQPKQTRNKISDLTFFI